MTQLERILTGTLYLLIIGILSPVQASESVGQVLAASGEVYAQGPDGRRDLKRRSEFFLGETLHTGVASSAQLRLQDGALLALQANTEFRVDSYSFDTDDPSAGKSVSTLLKGGFRTITGVIGKQDPDAYRVDTPVATIGVRGTHYEAVLIDGLSVAAWEGQVVVANEQGTILLGGGASFNFARIGPQMAPRGQLRAPAGLQGALPIPASPEVRNKPAAPSQAPGPGPAAAGRSAPRQPAVPGAVPTGPRQSLAGMTPPPPVPPMGLLPPPGMPAPLPHYAPNGEDLAAGGFRFQPPLNSTGDLPIAGGVDLRLSEAEKNDLNYLGFALVSGPGIMNTIGGKATNGSAGSPVIAEVGVNPGQPGFNSLPFTKIVRQGAAPLFMGTVNTRVIDAQHKIDWGVWNASPGNAAVVQHDPGNPSNVTQITRPVFWLSGNPTDLAVASARTGLVTYGGISSWPSHGLAVQGGGSAGLIDASNFRLQADVDFSNGTVTGNVQITPSGENWNIGFTGTMVNGFLSAPPGSHSGTVMTGAGSFGVDGDIGGSLTGASGQALTGSFDFEAIGNPNIHTEGIFIVDECATGC